MFWAIFIRVWGVYIFPTRFYNKELQKLVSTSPRSPIDLDDESIRNRKQAKSMSNTASNVYMPQLLCCVLKLAGIMTHLLK